LYEAQQNRGSEKIDDEEEKKKPKEKKYRSKSE